MKWIRIVFRKPQICGQALVEVLLAMSILVSSFIGLINVHLTASEWVADSRALTRAGIISCSFFEALRSGSLQLDWTLMDSGEWVELKNCGGNFSLNPVKGQTMYAQLQRQEAGLYQVGVKIEWKRRGGKNSVEIYSTIREAAINKSPGQ